MQGSFKNLDSSNISYTKITARKYWTVDFSGSIGSGSSSLSGVEIEIVPVTSSAGVMYKTAFYTGSIPEWGATTGSFDIDLQTTEAVSGSRNFPVSGNIVVITIPQKYTGVSISNFSLTTNQVYCTKGNIPDGELYNSASNDKVGDIIYTKGKVVITDASTVGNISSYSGSISCSWKSHWPVHTWTINCPVKDREFNYTYNRTFTDESRANKDIYPYITSIGLYNDESELVAVAKLSKPIKKDPNVDYTFQISIDI